MLLRIFMSKFIFALLIFVSSQVSAVQLESGGFLNCPINQCIKTSDISPAMVDQNASDDYLVSLYPEFKPVSVKCYKDQDGAICDVESHLMSSNLQVNGLCIEDLNSKFKVCR